MNFLKQISKRDTCFCINFQGLFKDIVFRSVTLITKKVWAILDFFSQTGLFTPLYSMHKKIIFFKNPLNFYLLKVKKIHGDSVKN